MNKTRNIVLAVVAFFVIVSIASCDSDDAKSDAKSDSSVTAPKVEDAVDTAPEAEEPEVEVDPDVQFKALFSQDAGVLGEVADEGGAAGDAFTNMDIDSGVSHARSAADLLGGLVNKYEGMDETQASDYGRDAMDYLAQCEDAWNASADAAATLDTDGMNAAATDLNTCSANMNDLTARM